MAIVSHANRFIYLLNPRTASTATAKALQDHVPCETVPAKDILDKNGKMSVPSKHTTLAQLRDHGLLDRQQIDSYFKFVTVRNPFDSVVSNWAKKVKDYAGLLDNPDSWVHKLPGYADELRQSADLSFPEWVKQRFAKNLKNGRGIHMNLKYADGMDFVLKFESLAEDIEKIAPRIGLPNDFQIPMVNVTKGRRETDYRSYYDERAVEIVSMVFREELKALNYRY